ncbi:hypothetical protein CDAR_198591 [Caerostris darwini]|uniref:Uncharacterized protein n=1 Tax=Caerostris darwini TaxID=1538125 RepID=A0AAV4W6H7_9ARAC|nr:hypothetical protein CDAR_198591 [Caerostris darwini]
MRFACKGVSAGRPEVSRGAMWGRQGDLHGSGGGRTPAVGQGLTPTFAGLKQCSRSRLFGSPVAFKNECVTVTYIKFTCIVLVIRFRYVDESIFLDYFHGNFGIKMKGMEQSISDPGVPCQHCSGPDFGMLCPWWVLSWPSWAARDRFRTLVLSQWHLQFLLPLLGGQL